MSVNTWRDTIELKTYPLGPDDPNPPFQRQGGPRSVYPYPLRDDLLEGPPETRRYTALHLENEYLHLIVLPELGGRVYSLYDKVCGREVFYRNNVVKYGLVALRGAWISGGIEFNFPSGHTYTTVDPVSWELTERDGAGGAAISIANACRMSGMEWGVLLTLRSGERVLHQDVRLANRTLLPERYWFWSNAAMPATDDLRLVLPTHRVRVGGGIIDYPVSADGRDLSWYRNHDRAGDIFTLDVTDDYFGCHYADSDFGMANNAAFLDVAGRKFFTWGTADDGMIWVDLLTDDDGQYVELQSGRFETQSEWGLLQPYRAVTWSERWLPIHGMGGWVCADGDGALNFALSDGGIRIGANVTCYTDPGTLTLRADGARVWRRTMSLVPEEPFCADLELPPGCGPETEFMLTLDEETDEGPERLLTYRHPPAHARGPRSCAAGSAGAARPGHLDDCSAEELCARATEALVRLEHSEARRLCERALTLDAGFSRAHTLLGLLDLRMGLYEPAREHLRAALRRDPRNTDAGCLLGWALHRLGDHEQALLAMRRAAHWYDDDTWPHGLAQKALGERRADPRRVHPQQLPWFISGGLCGALMRPTWMLLDEEPEPLAAFLRWARDDAHQCLAAYLVSQTQDRYRLLELALEHCPDATHHPMVHYLLAHHYHLRGSEKKLERALARARECPVDYCFPAHLEELDALQFAVEQDPADWKARYLLGNVLAAHDRTQEAMAQWRDAERLDDGFAVLHRNLGLGALRWEDDPAEAAAHYRRAIERNPTDYRYYLDLAAIMARLGRPPAERLELFRSAPEDVQAKWQIAAQVAQLLVELGLYDGALETLRAHRFFPWEGARHMRTVYVNCLLGRAEREANAGDHAAALADLEAALEYPRNLGVGRPARPHDARIHWLAACAAEEVGDEEKKTAHLAAAAEEPHDGPCEADWWKLQALSRLGRADEAARLQDALRSWAEGLLGNATTEAQGKAMLDRLGGPNA